MTEGWGSFGLTKGLDLSRQAGTLRIDEMRSAFFCDVVYFFRLYHASMAEGERDIRREAAESAKAMMRRHEAEPERKALAEPEIDEVYLGDISSQLFELQGEKARLEGAGATAAELKMINKEIASLQAFVDEHAEDYRRMEMPAEKVREIEAIPLTREKAGALPKDEAQRDISAHLKDLQKRYDLNAKQLATETDPAARAALENGLDSLRERIHVLKADLPWEKEDRVLAKGGIKRSSAARVKGREDAEKSFEAAEIDRATLVDLRDSYAQSLESGLLPKGGEILLLGAVQTLDDALARYGRGDMSADAFQKRVAEISKARKMWDRYVTDSTVEAERIKDIERRGKESRERLETTVRRRKEQAKAEARAAAESAAAEKVQKKEKMKLEEDKFRTWLEEAKAKRQAQKDELKGQMDDIFETQREREVTETALPPENLPVEPVAETEEAFKARFRAEARGMADEIVIGSVERTTAKIDELQKKKRAEQQRLSGDVSESAAEERFFAQGENPEELAKREQAMERSPELPPDEAMAQQEQIEARSARDFENEISFTAAFLDAVEKDPSHRISMVSAQEYAKQYWKLLMKDNVRLTEAMKPQPKVGFFRKLFGGTPKPKQTMTPQEVIQFQKMDKLVRDIMETPSMSLHAQELRSTSGRSNTSGYIGIGRGRPS